MKYHFKVHTAPDGLWAECLELKGCVTQSEINTKDDLYKNMTEALNLYLEEEVDSNTIDPLPDMTLTGKTNVVEVPVDPRIAFSVLIRHERKKRGLTQEEMRKKLNMKGIYSYQRLEKRIDPRLSTIAKIREVFPDISLDQLFCC
ncbi:MAG TPA: type II toxin-antitoxin system HicB family antitoxin [Spirochaetota bacterium]|nr:type II toxin-antitoxin system HicB family antitoxin [Spirochaetota bacterium]